MVDEKIIMPYNFFKYGGKYTGEHYGMRFRIVREGEKPDFVFMAVCWQGPLCFEQADKSLVLSKEFSFDEEGRLNAIQWLLDMYEEHKKEWEKSISILDMPINLNAMYASKE